ncbi:hypothetical protein [Salinispora fenicalii]|uniref:hypothetical protein n=1 Tax=Salinispora fenicalii TaxID=1137263 RepID=UPI0004898F30|nr:hypothetical protein [Salinispora fenicalii]
MGDDWLAGENIDVDIQQLDDFAAAIKDELEKNFSPSRQNGVVPMLQVQAPFGEGGMREGMYFQTSHDHSLTAIQQLLAEVEAGLASLSVAAKSISVAYLAEDALIEATHDDVFSAFYNVEEQQTLNNSWQQGNDDQASSVDSHSEARVDSAATRFEEEFILREGDGSGEGPSTHDQPETVGKGSAAYQIQGDDEGMRGDAVAPPDTDLQG